MKVILVPKETRSKFTSSRTETPVSLTFKQWSRDKSSQVSVERVSSLLNPVKWFSDPMSTRSQSRGDRKSRSKAGVPVSVKNLSKYFGRYRVPLFSLIIVFTVVDSPSKYCPNLEL